MLTLEATCKVPSVKEIVPGVPLGKRSTKGAVVASWANDIPTAYGGFWAAAFARASRSDVTPSCGSFSSASVVTRNRGELSGRSRASRAQSDRIVRFVARPLVSRPNKLRNRRVITFSTVGRRTARPDLTAIPDLPSLIVDERPVKRLFGIPLAHQDMRIRGSSTLRSRPPAALGPARSCRSPSRSQGTGIPAPPGGNRSLRGSVRMWKAARTDRLRGDRREGKADRRRGGEGGEGGEGRAGVTRRESRSDRRPRE
jgi:hypothetical protein